MPNKQSAQTVGCVCRSSVASPHPDRSLMQPVVCLQKLQEQDERAELLKDRLRWEQQELRMRLQQLQGSTERMRNDSLGSAVSSERSDSDRGNFPVVTLKTISIWHS